MNTPGIILLDKRAGLSSAHAIAEVKRRLNLPKIGHAGTLDPFATGLLVCLINSATRLASFAQDGMKEYEGQIEFGLSTSTDDITGEILTRSQVIPSFEAIQHHAQAFVGEISQVPPNISAVKVQGQRAYARVRSGETIELTPRSLKVYDFNLEALEPTVVRFKLRCSSGTYVRAIARDLGAALGCGACLKTLRRVASEPFRVEKAQSIEQMTASDIIDIGTLFPGSSMMEVERYVANALRAGNQSVLGDLDLADQGQFVLYAERGTTSPLGMIERRGDSWVLGLNFT